MSFRVRLTKHAEADFEQRLSILAERSPEAALRLNDRFEEALFRLRDFPFSRWRRGGGGGDPAGRRPGPDADRRRDG